MSQREMDFVAVDDSGGFTYYRTSRDLVSTFEYVGEATCIIDRTGIQYRLALDPDRHIVLGPGLHPVEFAWLSEAWMEDLKVPGQHRLRRFQPKSLATLLSDLFETLGLESGSEGAASPWLVCTDGGQLALPSLADVDRRLSGLKHLDTVEVQDPFGRTYRPVRHHWRPTEPFAHSILYYVEIPSGHEPQLRNSASDASS